MRYPLLLICFLIVLLSIGHAWALEPIQSPSSLKEMVTKVSHGKAVLAQPKLQTARPMMQRGPLRDESPPAASERMRGSNEAAKEHRGLVPRAPGKP